MADQEQERRSPIEEIAVKAVTLWDALKDKASDGDGVKPTLDQLIACAQVIAIGSRGDAVIDAMGRQAQMVTKALDDLDSTMVETLRYKQGDSNYI